MRKLHVALAGALLAFTFSCSGKNDGEKVSSSGAYSDEAHAVLGRGLVSFRSGNHVLLSWRLVPEDPKEVRFRIYRKEHGERNEKYELIGETVRTSYQDQVLHGEKYSYAIRTIHDGNEERFSREAIPLSSIEGNAALAIDVGEKYKQVRVVTGDLNADGEPEFVVAYADCQNVVSFGKAWTKSEDTVKVAAFLPTGQQLWKMDLGWGIESGHVYQPMVVWDLDGDGRAEVILKTNKSSDPRDYNGERLTVLDGMTGRIKKEAKWPSLKGLGSDYNNDSRNYLAIAHLDGKDPYIIAVRGTYKVQKIWAFDKDLHRVWERTPGIDHHYPTDLRERLLKFWNIDDKGKWLWARLMGKPIVDQWRGSHRLPIADINDDGKEEILWGERCIGENGKDLWAIKEKMPYPGHPDIVFPARILPHQKGMQIFYGREGGEGESDRIGVYLVDQHGKILWSNWGYSHVDRGWAGKITTDREGMQLFAIDISGKKWSTAGAKLIEPRGYLWDSGGNTLGDRYSAWYWSFPADWDGDGVREIVVDGKVQKYGGPVVAKLPTYLLWAADLFGDHREEIVAAPRDGKIYIIQNMKVLDGVPRVTPMADRLYRNTLSRTAMHSTVFPTEGGYIQKRPDR